VAVRAADWQFGQRRSWMLPDWLMEQKNQNLTGLVWLHKIGLLPLGLAGVPQFRDNSDTECLHKQ
jgi:hypothetical protein